MRQLHFEFNKNYKKEFGGSLLLGQRKTARPIATKAPMHFVLKSEKARANLSFVNHRRHIEVLIATETKKSKIKLYEFAVNFNHIHLVVLIRDRAQYKKWIRGLTAAIVGLLAKRTGQALGNFFTLRPYSKILSWGRQFRGTLEYQIKNQMELFNIYRPKKARARAAYETAAPADAQKRVQDS